MSYYPPDNKNKSKVAQRNRKNKNMLKGFTIALGIVIAFALFIRATSNHPAELHHCLATSTDKTICDTLRD